MKTRILLLLLLLVLASCNDDKENDTPTTTPETAAGVIVVGEISDDPEEAVGYTQPFADYLAAQLADNGIGRGEVKVAPDPETMAEWMKTGEVDIYFDSLYPVMSVSEQSGATPFIRRWFDGVGEYHSVFFVLSNSALDSLDDLKGQTVAFDNQFSTSGYMVPAAHLLQGGYTLSEKPDTTAAVGADEIGYVFSNDDENTLQWVVSGRVAAGVVDNESLKELPQETLDQIKILEETNPIPRQVGLVRPNMDADLFEAIKTILLTMDESEEGLATLETLLTSQYDEFPEGIEAAIAEMQTLYQLVQGQ